MLSSHPLFMEGVASLLYSETGLDLLGRESDVDRAIEQIRTLHPDVIIVDAGDTRCAASSIVLRILQENCTAKVIGLNLNDNTLCVYHEEQRTVRGVADLMHALESDDDAQMDEKGGSTNFQSTSRRTRQF